MKWLRRELRHVCLLIAAIVFIKVLIYFFGFEAVVVGALAGLLIQPTRGSRS